eukprot:2142564-Rhodomonas_salina.2
MLGGGQTVAAAWSAGEGHAAGRSDITMTVHTHTDRLHSELGWSRWLRLSQGHMSWEGEMFSIPVAAGLAPAVPSYPLSSLSLADCNLLVVRAEDGGRGLRQSGWTL